MDIYVYSDESGVFDKAHNKVYVFGGLIYLNKADKDEYTRKYKKAESDIRANGCYDKHSELKACKISNKEKNKLFRSLNQCIKFGAIVNQESVNDEIFKNKKSKQRYLDYVYKICLKNALNKLIKSKVINPDDVRNIYIFADEHTTATNGRYELKEGLEQEFKVGTINYRYNIFYKPIFTSLDSIQLYFCDSASKILIRAADIVANHIYFKTTHDMEIQQENLFVSYFP